MLMYVRAPSLLDRLEPLDRRRELFLRLDPALLSHIPLLAEQARSRPLLCQLGRHRALLVQCSLLSPAQLDQLTPLRLASCRLLCSPPELHVRVCQALHQSCSLGLERCAPLLHSDDFGADLLEANTALRPQSLQLQPRRVGGSCAVERWRGIESSSRKESSRVEFESSRVESESSRVESESSRQDPI